MNIHTAEINVISDLYVAGYKCDGWPFHAERFYVMLELADGTRYAHNNLFLGCQVEHDEEGYPTFLDTRLEACAKAEKLAQRVREAGVINPAYWREIDPAYGSTAYQANGTEYERAMQDRNAE